MLGDKYATIKLARILLNAVYREEACHISRGIFKSQGRNQRGSANYPTMSPLGCLSFSEVTQFGVKTDRVCICGCPGLLRENPISGGHLWAEMKKDINI